MLMKGGFLWRFLASEYRKRVGSLKESSSFDQKVERES
jgi:hypothetical protein